jgi:hypothetical protein
MKRIWLTTTLLSGALLSGALFANPGSALDWSAGAFIGSSIPIAQEDNSAGLHFGVRVPVRVQRFLLIEPFYAGSSMRSVTYNIAGFDYSRDGMDIDTFGLNVGFPVSGLLPSLDLVPYVGMGANRMSYIGPGDSTEPGYNFGLSCRLDLPSRLAADLRGEFTMITDGATSRKHASISLGLLYAFSPTPREW